MYSVTVCVAHEWTEMLKGFLNPTSKLINMFKQDICAT